MAVKLSPVYLDAQFIDGVPAVGAKLFTYAAGSTTKQATYTDSSGTVANSNPIILDARGETPAIWLASGQIYKFVLASPTDSDPPTSPIRVIDNISGVNDTSINIDEWVASSLTPTYLSATQFTVAGDQTSSFQVNRRVKLLVSAGTVYGYISASSFTTLTTVTVTLDSGALDTGVSQVFIGLLSYQNSSIPSISDSIFRLIKSASGLISARFDLSGLSASRIFAFPDKSGTLAIDSDITSKFSGVTFDWPGTTAPAGAMALPLVPTNVSRTTYASIFAAIGTTWGIGDGSTTFGLPYCPENQSIIQANGNVGSSTNGQVIAHTHVVSVTNAAYGSGGLNPGSTLKGSGGDVQYTGTYSATSQSTGGGANLPAGVRMLKCIWL